MSLATGWRPYSIVSVNENGEKEYFEYRRFDPFSMTLGLAADFAEMSGSLSDEENENMMMTMAMALAKNLTNKTYITGITEVVNAFSLPSKRYQGFDLTQFRKDGVGQDSYDRLQELTGQVKLGGRTLAASLERLISSKHHQGLPMPDASQDERIKEVRKVLSKYRAKAMSDVLKEYPQIKLSIKQMEQQARGPTKPSPIVQKLLGQ